MLSPSISRIKQQSKTLTKAAFYFHFLTFKITNNIRLFFTRLTLLIFTIYADTAEGMLFDTVCCVYQMYIQISF